LKEKSIQNLGTVVQSLLITEERIGVQGVYKLTDDFEGLYFSDEKTNGKHCYFRAVSKDSCSLSTYM
jgi:hypothetical protein